MIISSTWDTGSHDVLADLEAVRQRILEEASRPLDPDRFRMRFHPVSKARWDWLLEGGYIDSQGNLTEKGADAIGTALALRFGLLEPAEETGGHDGDA